MVELVKRKDSKNKDSSSLTYHQIFRTKKTDSKVIKVLIVAEETERNTFIHNLSKALRENDCRVDIGIDKFWTSESILILFTFIGLNIYPLN